MPAILSRADEERLQRAIRNSPKNRRREELQNRIEVIRRQTEEKKQKEAEAFEAWHMVHEWMVTLEIIRDANTPKTPDEQWNEAFCTAIEMLPEARERARELWLEYAAMKGGD